MKTNARITNQYRVAETSDFDDMSRVFDNDIQAYKNLAEKAQRLGITVDMNEVNRLTDLAKAKDLELTRLFGLQKNQGFLPKYGSYK